MVVNHLISFAELCLVLALGNFIFLRIFVVIVVLNTKLLLIAIK